MFLNFEKEGQIVFYRCQQAKLCTRRAIRFDFTGCAYSSHTQVVKANETSLKCLKWS
jgi:hypothetical protein